MLLLQEVLAKQHQYTDTNLLLVQEAMARQAPTYAAHIAEIRTQTSEQTAAEKDWLREELQACTQT